MRRSCWLRAVSPAAPAALPSLLPATTARALARGTLQISCVNGRSGVEHRSGQQLTGPLQNWHRLSHTLLPGWADGGGSAAGGGGPAVWINTVRAHPCQCCISSSPAAAEGLGANWQGGRQREFSASVYESCPQIFAASTKSPAAARWSQLLRSAKPCGLQRNDQR